MPDVYATIAEADVAVQSRLVEAMEIRGAEPQQAAMRDSFVAAIRLPKNARVLEIGCGTGIVCRTLAARSEVSEVIGVDPSPVFLGRAKELSAGMAKISLVPGDARRLDFADRSFDAVVIYTVLTHIPGPEQALAEAYRVLKPGGVLAVLDGDYATTTVATGDADPLQACADAAMAALVHDRWLVRKLPLIVQQAGFELTSLASHGYAEVASPTYLLSIVDRGADALVANSLIGASLAAALKAEARERVAAGRFFGHIAYASLMARPS